MTGRTKAGFVLVMIAAARCATATMSTLDKELAMIHSIRSRPRWISISWLGNRDYNVGDKQAQTYKPIYGT